MTSLIGTFGDIWVSLTSVVSMVGQATFPLLLQWKIHTGVESRCDFRCPVQKNLTKNIEGVAIILIIRYIFIHNFLICFTESTNSSGSLITQLDLIPRVVVWYTDIRIQDTTDGPQKHRKKIDTFDIKWISPMIVHSNYYLWSNTYSFYEVFTFPGELALDLVLNSLLAIIGKEVWMLETSWINFKPQV